MKTQNTIVLESKELSSEQKLKKGRDFKKELKGEKRKESWRRIHQR